KFEEPRHRLQLHADGEVGAPAHPASDGGHPDDRVHPPPRDIGVYGEHRRCVRNTMPKAHDTTQAYNKACIPSSLGVSQGLTQWRAKPASEELGPPGAE